MTNPLDKLNLRPFERRLVVGVAALLFLVINIVWVWPHFKDWGETKLQLEDLRSRLTKYNTAIAQKGEYTRKVKELEADGLTVAAQDQANQFFRAVNNQATISGVTLLNNSRPSTRTNEFFLEQLLTIRVAAREEQLVDFLYQLGSGDSMIRARSLSLRPNAPRQQLEGNIDLVASYQKNPASKAAKSATPASTKKK